MLFIDKIINHHLSSNLSPTKKNNDNNTKYIPLTYFGKFNYRIANIYRKYGLTPAFKTNNNLKTKLTSPNNNDTKCKDRFNKSGVYSVICDDCSASYIGKTERNFNLRYKEHISNPQSLYQHKVQEKHRLSNIENNLKILHTTKDKQLISTLEAFEIRKAILNDQPLLNAQIDLSPILDLCCTLEKSA